MAIPDFQCLVLLLVKILGTGPGRTMREVTGQLAEFFQLRVHEREERPTYPSESRSASASRDDRILLRQLSDKLDILEELIFNLSSA